MKCAIFYLRVGQPPIEEDYFPVVTDAGVMCWVRAEEVDVTDDPHHEFGLDEATPRKGEMVMNAHPLTNESKGK